MDSEMQIKRPTGDARNLFKNNVQPTREEADQTSVSDIHNLALRRNLFAHWIILRRRTIE